MAFRVQLAAFGLFCLRCATSGSRPKTDRTHWNGQKIILKREKKVDSNLVAQFENLILSATQSRASTRGEGSACVGYPFWQEMNVPVKEKIYIFFNDPTKH